MRYFYWYICLNAIYDLLQREQLEGLRSMFDVVIYRIHGSRSIARR